MDDEYETLRWPTNMDRESIVDRLVEMRKLAHANDRAELVAFFVDVEQMPSPRIGASVISALSFVEGKPEYKAFGTQLSMIAMNLKNLK